MSAYQPRRRPDFIGCNVKPGHTPGGFTKSFASGKTRTRQKRGESSSDAIKAAAEATLRRHGWQATGSDFERTVQPPTNFFP